MFGVESIFQGKNPSNRHSWLTCITSSREIAELNLTRTSVRAVEQRLFEFNARAFPVHFVGGSLSYSFLPLAEVIAKLNSAPIGKPGEVMFNVYKFSREYVWGVQENSSHFHITNETVADFRAGRGELYAALNGSEV
jgi:hypothetical protein